MEVESSPSGLSECVIVVSDFRAVPVCAAIQLALNSTESRFLISRAQLLHNDFGDGTSRLQKRFIIAVLRLFATVELVSSSPDDYRHPGYHGARSSLISMTSDLMATPAKYPTLADPLQDLVAGSLSVLRRVRGLDSNRVYVFNGRTASSQPLASELMKTGQQRVQVYEWGGKYRRSFKVVDYPLHDTVAESRRVANWAEARNFEFDARGAKNYIREKLSYKYELPHDEEFCPIYATVIFAGSPHEHAVVEIDNLTALDGDTFSLIERCLSLRIVKLPAALRLHPNMAKDPSILSQISRLNDFLSIHGIDLIAPAERVSAQKLIESADQVIVGNSSVGLDAIFLGKQPLIVGHPPYKDLVETVERKFPGSVENPSRIAGLLDAYEEPHTQKFGLRATLFWLVFRVYEQLCAGYRLWGSR